MSSQGEAAPNTPGSPGKTASSSSRFACAGGHENAFPGKYVMATRQLAISHDGSMLAFVGERNGVDRLYLRRLDQLQAVPLVTAAVSEPSSSPRLERRAASTLRVSPPNRFRVVP